MRLSQWKRLFCHGDHDYLLNLILVLIRDTKIKNKVNRRKAQTDFLFSALLFFISILFFLILHHLDSLRVGLNKFIYLISIVSLVIRLKKPTDFTITYHDVIFVCWFLTFHPKSCISTSKISYRHHFMHRITQYLFFFIRFP